MPEPRKPAKVPMTERLQALMVEYGSLALWVYFAIFALTLGGFALAISLGFHVKGNTMAVGTWGAAYLATKLLQPLRIIATLVLTPVVMKVLRLKKRDPHSSGKTQ
jgi:hypothetical protein